jgi:hypothetical protein
LISVLQVLVDQDVMCCEKTKGYPHFFWHRVRKSMSEIETGSSWQYVTVQHL